MKLVYIFGPIHLFGEDYLSVYKNLTKVSKKYFDKVICTYPDFWETKETSKEFYKRTYETITKCHLFIGEVSSPSMGVGMEFQMAQEKNIPCVALVKEGVKVSSMIKGIPCIKRIISYKNFKDLKNQVEKAIKDYYKGKLKENPL